MNDIFIYVVLAGMIGLMYMNSRKRKKQMAELKSAIVVGAQVVLHSGITGKIVSMDGDRLVIETTPGTKLNVVQGAVRGLDSWKSEKPAEKPATKKTVASKKPATKTASKPAAKKAAPKSTAK